MIVLQGLCIIIHQGVKTEVCSFTSARHKKCQVTATAPLRSLPQLPQAPTARKAMLPALQSTGPKTTRLRMNHFTQLKNSNTFNV